MVRSNPLRASVGGVLLAALLLTGCGTEDDDAAAAPSSSASTGFPADSSPPSAPGSGATPVDYVPASLEGPAQNVPKPVMPDLAREESREGAQAFLDYWSDAMWYAYQTGDTSYARDIISQHCDVCMDQLGLLEEIYDSGAWAIGGRESVAIQEPTITPAADGVYKPIVSGTAEGAKLIEAGQVTLDVPPDYGVDDPHIIYLDYVQEEWVYISAANLPGTKYATS
jgi:hypothetical protein